MRASNSATSLELRMLTKMCPLPSATAASGSPPKAIVPATFSVAGSIEVPSLVPWLKVMTRLLAGS